ncbi:IPExxxVDY family protein [Salegentibacter chungangensis]|uniref:IPExxxVDY family protein n=1 Tax=Salegentibacter chungangensis TaxID=1335724 RepID=A0ABW3NND6_9FLAO
MQSHKMLLDEVEEDHFKLIAVYCAIEDYKMAFLLNKHLHLQLKRERYDVDFNHKTVRARYALYTFKDPTNYRTYHLVANKFKGQAKRVASSGSLFVEEEVRPLEVHLIPEQKKVDFFLKIEEDLEEQQLTRMVNTISQIPQVVAVYNIDIEHLKSKQNLIFE